MVGRVPHCEGGLRVESWGTTFPFGTPLSRPKTWTLWKGSLDPEPGLPDQGFSPSQVCEHPVLGPCEKGHRTLSQVYQTLAFTKPSLCASSVSRSWGKVLTSLNPKGPVFKTRTEPGEKTQNWPTLVKSPTQIE